MLFLDHGEDMYLEDFTVSEELGLLKSGALIVADNVVRPGAPEYREFVRRTEGLKGERGEGIDCSGRF